MVPLNRIGKVNRGPLAGWFIQIQAMERPKGFLVSRARNATMDQTVVLDGIFPDSVQLEAFLEANAPQIEWEPEPAG